MDLKELEKYDELYQRGREVKGSEDDDGGRVWEPDLFKLV